jgi:hypothetical protein
MNHNVFSQFAYEQPGITTVPRDVIAFDMTVDHSCLEIWGILQAPDWYPRFFRGLGSCEQISGNAQQFEVRLSTPRGVVVVHEMHQTLRRSSMLMWFHATQVSHCFVSIRLTPEEGGTRIAVRIFGVGLLHPTSRKPATAPSGPGSGKACCVSRTISKASSRHCWSTWATGILCISAS